MNELIDRLTNRLEGLAETADAHRDIDAVVAGAPRQRSTMTTHSARTVVRVAAVAVAIAGVGAIIALAGVQDSSGTLAPIETEPAVASLPAAPTSRPTAPAETTVPAEIEPEFDAGAAVDPARLSQQSWLLPTWLPDGYEVLYAFSHPEEAAGLGSQSVAYENSGGDTIGLVVSSSQPGQSARPWSREAIGTGFDASARTDSTWATISASRIDAASFNRLVAGAMIGTLDDVPQEALLTFPDPARADPVATYDADGVTVALYADGVNGYYCLQGPFRVCPQTIPDGEIMTSHGGGATAGVEGSAVVTSTASGIVKPIVDRVEVEFIDGQRLSVRPTDLTGRFNERFWLVRTDVELDEPLAFGKSPTNTVETVTAYDSDGNILHIDIGM